MGHIVQDNLSELEIDFFFFFFFLIIYKDGKFKS